MISAIRLALVSPADTIELRNDAADFLRAANGSGWGLAPVAHQWFRGAGDGARHRGTRRVERTYVLPVACFGKTPAEVESKLRRLARVIRDPFVIQATYPGGEVFTIPAVYESGGEGAYGADGTPVHARLPLVFKCGDPFWTSQQLQTVSWYNTSQVSFLDTLTLSGASLSGVREVVNYGDVDAKPSWVIQGPFDTLSVSVGGIGFEFDTPFLSTGTLYIQWKDDGWVVEDETGANRYDGFVVGSVPRFPSFPQGVSQVEVTVTGIGIDTRVSAYWPERREVVY